MIELVWAYLKEHRLHEPERRNHARGASVALKPQSPLLRLLNIPEGQVTRTPTPTLTRALTLALTPALTPTLTLTLV